MSFKVPSSPKPSSCDSMGRDAGWIQPSSNPCAHLEKNVGIFPPLNSSQESGPIFTAELSLFNLAPKIKKQQHFGQIPCQEITSRADSGPGAPGEKQKPWQGWGMGHDPPRSFQTPALLVPSFCFTLLTGKKSHGIFCHVKKQVGKIKKMYFLISLVGNPDKNIPLGPGTCGTPTQSSAFPGLSSPFCHHT